MLYDFLPEMKSAAITDFEEITGKGIRAKIQGIEVIIGSAAFAGSPDENTVLQTAVHITINEQYILEVCFNNQYREGLESLFQSLKDNIKSKCCPEITREKSLETLLPQEPNWFLISRSKTGVHQAIARTRKKCDDMGDVVE
jgi:Cu+-exporting ATPase